MRNRMNHEHPQHDHFGEGPRRGRGPGRGRPDGEPGPRGGARRAGRGAVAQSVLVLLAEQPRHGYELITALEERSGGRWRPSPGAIYPALRKLVERGLITASEDDGKTRYALTDEGRQWVDGAAEVGFTEPWADAGGGHRGNLHRQFGELAGPVRQIARFGTPEQALAAEAILKRATSELYTVLATPPSAATDTTPETSPPAA